MTDQKNGQEYLSFVLEKLQARLAEISQSLLDGQKEIENMHDYYWQNYTEMDQYGYEDYDNQQALLHQVNANQEQLSAEPLPENAGFSVLRACGFLL